MDSKDTASHLSNSPEEHEMESEKSAMAIGKADTGKPWKPVQWSDSLPTFVDPMEFPALKREDTQSKVSAKYDDDNGEYVVGESKNGTLEEEEEEAELVRDDENKGLKENFGIEVETSGGDSIIEAVNIALPEPEVTVVGGIEASEDIKGVEDYGSKVETDVSVVGLAENSVISGFDDDDVVTKASTDVVESSVDGAETIVATNDKEELAETIVATNDKEELAQTIAATDDIDELEGEVVLLADKGLKESDPEAVGVTDEMDVLAKNQVDAAETIVATNDQDELEGEVVLLADKRLKEIDPEVVGATDETDVLANNQLDAGNRDGTPVIESVVEAAQNPVAQNDINNHVSSVNEKSDDEVSGKLDISETAESTDVILYAENEGKNISGAEFENADEGSVTDGEADDMIFGSSEAAKQFLEELERGSAGGSYSAAETLHDDSQKIDGQIVTDSDEEVDTDEEGEGKELFDSSALAALLKAATNPGSEGGSITVTSADGSRLYSVERPAGLGSSLRPMKPPAARQTRPSLFGSSNFTTAGDADNTLSDEEKKKLEKLQQIRVKFLRLVHRLGHSPEEPVAGQVLYRLALIAGRQTNQLFSLDAAKRTALQLEDESKDDLDFSLNMLVVGKTGVGKSATINSIFGEEKSSIHAFVPATNSVREISGVVGGVKIRVIDSPGLKSSGSEQGLNRKILNSIKSSMKRCSPDVVLYVDRLDTQTRDLNDLPMLRSITSSLGSSIWRNAVVTLTHGASAPPDGPSGSPLNYETFVAQRSHVVQQSIGQAVGDLRLMSPSMMNPVSLVENHSSCRKNREGQKVLPNGQSWRSQLLLLCYSLKILSEASSLSKPQDPFDHRKLFGFRSRAPPLPYLLSWLLQSRSHPKLSTDQGGDGVDSDVDLADLSDSDQEEEEDEYDQLPPFKPLRKTQLAKLSKDQKKAYFEEYDYRVKLLQKKQWREELRRMREIKKKGKVAADEYGYNGEDVDPENGAPAAVPVPLPDMVLPPSFDGNNPAYRYRFLEPTSQFLARPVLDTHGWDHDCGYDGVNVEHSLAVANRFPAAVAVQVTKDKKEFSIHLDSSVSAKHGENGSSMAGFDIQNVGKQLAYILRGETKFKNFRMNKTAAGVSVTFLGQNVATGFKLEDQIALGKRLVLVGSTGTVRSQGDSAYGANLEVKLREADFPIGQDQSSLGLSLVKWRGDLALGANLQAQFSIGRSSKIAVRAGLNNKMSGQLTVRTSSSEQLQLAFVSLLPIAMSIYKRFWPGVSESYSMY